MQVDLHLSGAVILPCSEMPIEQEWMRLRPDWRTRGVCFLNLERVLLTICFLFTNTWLSELLGKKLAEKTNRSRLHKHLNKSLKGYGYRKAAGDKSRGALMSVARTI